MQQKSEDFKDDLPLPRIALATRAGSLHVGWNGTGTMSREAKRTGLTSLLFAILRPRDACGASVDADTVRLTFGFGLWSTDIPLGDVEAVHVADGRCWSSIRIRHPAGDSHVSGLPRMAASALADALETARREWCAKL